MSCPRCGRRAAASAGTAPFDWSTSTGADGDVHLICAACTRGHVRDIESRLDEEWWTADAPGHDVLVVDDDETVALIVRVAFEEIGYEVHHASTGADALQQAAASRPAVMIIDVQLPDIDGWEVRERLRARHGAVPAVMLSAYPIDGPDDVACLSKPFDTDELVATVRRVVQAGAGLA